MIDSFLDITTIKEDILIKDTSFEDTSLKEDIMVVAVGDISFEDITNFIEGDILIEEGNLIVEDIIDHILIEEGNLITILNK